MEKRKERGPRRGGDDRDVRHSKKLSYLLRHGAEKEGLVIGSDGYVKVKDLTSRPDFKDIDLDRIKYIVENNDKKRFELVQREGEWLIRAAQGHTIKAISDDELLKKITIEDALAFETVVHGTFLKNWDPILKTGLNKMTRNHIHFAVGYPGEKAVISGMRGSCDLFIEVDIVKAVTDGVLFYLSTNKVLLSPGIDGAIPSKYFKIVKDKHGKVIFTNELPKKKEIIKTDEELARELDEEAKKE